MINIYLQTKLALSLPEKKKKKKKNLFEYTFFKQKIGQVETKLGRSAHLYFLSI